MCHELSIGLTQVSTAPILQRTFEGRWGRFRVCSTHVQDSPESSLLNFSRPLHPKPQKLHERTGPETKLQLSAPTPQTSKAYALKAFNPRIPKPLNVTAQSGKGALNKQNEILSPASTCLAGLQRFHAFFHAAGCSVGWGRSASMALQDLQGFRVLGFRVWGFRI